MYDAGGVGVINISSVHGGGRARSASAYVTAKHGLEGLSKVIALEGAPHGVTQQLRESGLRADPAGGEADR